MTSQELKNSILQYAVQGKLVPQNPNDEPASELLKRIKAEKEKLIKDKVIKKDKPLLPITDEEKPFEIPFNWEWARLSDYLDVRDGTHDTPKYVSQGIPLVTSKNLDNGTINFNNIKFISEDDHKIISQRSKVDDGDILFAMIGSIGNPVLVKKNREFSIKNMALFKPYMNTNTYMQYVFMYLSKEQEIMKKIATGGVQSFVSLSFIRNYLIPIPPLAEQQKIVEKIEELMPLVEQYGKAEAELKELNKAFPEKIKKSVLQYAIQGKLVPQNPQNEPASVLLEKIKAEKQKLIREKKIKADKPLPAITEEEIPFEIPDSWVWVRFANVIDLRDGTHDTPSYVEKGYPLITGKDFYNGYFDLSKTKYIAEHDYLKIIQRSKVDEGDILYSMIGGNIGSMILIENYFEMAIKNVALFKRYCADSIEPKYLMIYLKAQLENLKSQSKGGAQQFVPLNLLRAYPFALPPLSEQKLIVEKVEEVLSYCDKLK